MTASVPVAAQQVGSGPPVAVVIGPPWLRTGTGRVIEDQIGFYRDRGFATAFVGVPVKPTHVPENPMWVELAEATRELRADHASFAILDSRPRPSAPWRRVRQLLDHRTALDWIVEVGLYSRPPPGLISFLRQRRVALFHINHVFTLGFARRLWSELGLSNPPVLVETHDVQSRILYERAEQNPWTHRPDRLDLLVRSELDLLQQIDVLIHCSIEDRQFFVERLPDKCQFLARPVIDSAFVNAVERAHQSEIEPIDVLFVGTGYHANLEGVEWLLTKVWPLIADRGLVLRIVGGIADLLRAQRPNLYHQFSSFFVGRVADLVPYYRAARSVIAPMLSGGGISIKTVEAFALGMPFVGTTKAYRGFPQQSLIRNGIRGYDESRAFADALLRVLTPGDDTGTRGRAIYNELFAREACYAARDEAVRLALAIHQRSRKSSRPGNGEDSLQVLAIGSSNCIGPNSFIEKAGTIVGTRVQNLSIGACSSTLGLYQLDKIGPVRRGVAFIDFAINDNDTASNLWNREDADRVITDNILTITARLQALNFLPILLLCASDLDLEFEPLGYAVHRAVCLKERINFIDFRGILIGAVRRGGSKAAMMRDNFHLSKSATGAVAEFLAAVIGRMNATRPARTTHFASILPSRTLGADMLFPQDALVQHESYLRTASYGRLTAGETAHLPVREAERLRAIMINAAAKGGTIAVRNSESEVIKSMTAYWSPEHPERYSALLIDFARSPPGGPAGITMQIVGSEAVPTERTIHERPVVPDRYGELEIEGVLLTGCHPVELAYSRQSYDWLPLDLGELPETHRLSDRLAAMPENESLAAGS
jgi:glycosyltransferase involved in cell wall biosynthesis